MIQPGPVGYRDLADLLRQRIVSGQLAAGQRMPSETELRQQYGLARTTVRRAIDVLRHEGLIIVRHGHPSRVRDQPDIDDVTVPEGSIISARMPTPQERQEHDMPEGVPLLVVVDAGGGARVWPAHRYQIRAG